MHGFRAYVWSALNVDSGEVLVIYASWSRNMIVAVKFIRMVLDRCLNKSPMIFDRDRWYRWAIDRLGLEYRHERLGLRSRVKRFFRYLKERTMVFHHKLSARNYIQGVKNLKLFLNLFTLYYQNNQDRRWMKYLFGHYQRKF